MNNKPHFKSAGIKLPRHWSKMFGLTNVNKGDYEEILQVSGYDKILIESRH